MRSITFLADHCYNGGGLPEERREFRAGQTYEMPEPSAMHYVRQGRAAWAEGNGNVTVFPPALTAAVETADLGERGRAADKAVKAQRVRTKPVAKHAPTVTPDP